MSRGIPISVFILPKPGIIKTEVYSGSHGFAFLRANLSKISISNILSADGGSGENREFEINTSGDTYEAQIEYEMALQIIASLKAGISQSRSIGMSW